MTAIIHSDAPVDRIGAQVPFRAARRVRSLSDRSIAWLFVTPTIALLLAINIFPLIWMIRLSFTSLNLSMSYLPLRFVGLDNYADVLSDEDVWIRLQTTAQFVISTVALQVIVGFGLALLINRQFRSHSFWTTIILLPMMLSPAVVGNFWTLLLQPQIGPFNYVVGLFTGVAPSSFSMTGEVALAPWTIVLVDTWMWAPYVMLICLAGLRSIPDYIYEAAEVDRASSWRQFWSITLPMAHAVFDARGPVPRHRKLQDVRHGQSLNLRRARLDDGACLDHPEAGRVREVAHGLFLRARHHPVCHRLWRGKYLRQSAQPGEATMTAAAKSTAHSIVEASPRVKAFAAVIVIFYAIVTITPLLWIVATAFKSQSDAIAYPPKVIFQPTLEGYVNLFTVRTRQTPDFIASLPPATTWYDKLVRKHDMVVAGPSKVVPRFINSLVIGFGSTFLAVLLGALAAYAFSRFRIPLADDLLFFILSTRMMPPVAVAIPIYLMYRELNLTDTWTGMILLYTAVNVSLAVWLLKGFIDEIPREYEEAALVDGYTRLQALRKVVLPQAVTGIAATAIFCLIFSWNEYAFAVLLTSGDAQTMPPFIPFIIGEGGQDWPAVAAATTLFVIPIVLFTIVLRRHLLRGITFGAVRK